jgi:hypothetical protein
MGINPPQTHPYPQLMIGGWVCQPTPPSKCNNPPRSAPPVRVQHFRFLQVDESRTDEHLAASRCGTSPCPGASTRGGVLSSTATACCVSRHGAPPLLSAGFLLSLSRDYCNSLLLTNGRGYDMLYVLNHARDAALRCLRARRNTLS